MYQRGSISSNEILIDINELTVSKFIGSISVNNNYIQRSPMKMIEFSLHLYNSSRSNEKMSGDRAMSFMHWFQCVKSKHSYIILSFTQI